MSNYPRPILDYWRKAFEGTVVEIEADLTLSVVHTLSRKRPAMMLEGADGSVQAAITPELATAIDLETTGASATALRERLTKEGIAFHDPDFLFYLPADAAAEASHSAPARRLSEDDRAVFETFYATASEQDREDSYVELDQWAVFGCFHGDRLVSAASAILWDDSPVADLGVLTLPDARGKGCARAAVGSLSGFARQQGYEPQYRCQMDNQASIALAEACGFGLFGKWIVASGD